MTNEFLMINAWEGIFNYREYLTNVPKGIYFLEQQQLKQLHSDYKISLVLNTIFFIILIFLNPLFT